MYEALKVARGEYIGFLFDNCVLYPSAYERSLKKMKSEGADASYGRVLLYSSVDNTEKKYETQVYYNEKNLDNLESSNFIRNVSIILKKSIIDTIGFLDPHMCLYKVSDWDFITRIKRKFYLIDTGVLFSKEYNPNEESDNSVNFSIVEEYYKISDREKKLSLNNYEKINIFSKFEFNSSSSFCLFGFLTFCKNFLAKSSVKGNLSIASNIFFLKSTGFLLPLNIHLICERLSALLKSFINCSAKSFGGTVFTDLNS